jgi:hypothetical protein
MTAKTYLRLNKEIEFILDEEVRRRNEDAMRLYAKGFGSRIMLYTRSRLISEIIEAWIRAHENKIGDKK